MTTKQYLYAALFWTVIIMAIVGVPGNQIPKVSHFIDLLQPDKIVHIGMFAPFSFLWISYFSQKLKSIKNSIILVVLFGMLYAVITELLQVYVFIGRNGNFPDAIADFIGAIIGIVYFIKKANK
jgi:VanZ family protein